MKIGLAQMCIFKEDKEKNKLSCQKFIKQAQRQGIHLLLFPEMTLTGFSMKIEKIGETLDGETLSWFGKAAVEHNMHIGFGHVEASKPKGKNICSIVSKDGTEVLRYAKIHPFSYGTEAQFYEGGTKLKYTKIEDFNVSSVICYDLRFPEIFQCASKKAELITVIANWPKARAEHWITLLKARAIENQCYIAGVNCVGVLSHQQYSGDSIIIDPLGNVLSMLSDSEGLITAEIELDKVTSLRNKFPVKNDRKEDLYAKLYKE